MPAGHKWWPADRQAAYQHISDQGRHHRYSRKDNIGMEESIERHPWAVLAIRVAAVAIAVFQRPGSNALSTAQEIRATMEQLAPRLPPAPCCSPSGSEWT